MRTRVPELRSGIILVGRFGRAAQRAGPLAASAGPCLAGRRGLHQPRLSSGTLRFLATEPRSGTFQGALAGFDFADQGVLLRLTAFPVRESRFSCQNAVPWPKSAEFRARRSIPHRCSSFIRLSGALWRSVVEAPIRSLEAAPWLRATVFFAGSQRRKQMALPHVQNEGAWLDPMKRWVARRSAPVTPSVPYPLLKAPIENLGFAP